MGFECLSKGQNFKTDLIYDVERRKESGQETTTAWINQIYCLANFRLHMFCLLQQKGVVEGTPWSEMYDHSWSGEAQELRSGQHIFLSYKR